MKATNADLQALLERLKAEQHAIIDATAHASGMLSRGEIRSVAELENVIAAVMALIDERRN